MHALDADIGMLPKHAPEDANPGVRSQLKTGFRNAAYTFVLAGANIDGKAAAQSSLRMDIQDWSGFYDQYMHCYQVFPQQDTIPVPEIEQDLLEGVKPFLDSVKHKVTTRPNGGINFGGIKFKGALISFNVNGTIQDMGKAFSIMSFGEPATATQEQGSLKVDAPIPFWKQNDWVVSVKYAGTVVSTNSPENNTQSKEMIWTNKNMKDKRIQFEIKTP